MAELTLTNTTLSWRAGQRTADIKLADIRLVRFDTRLDFSVKATILPPQGRKLRIPFECTPPHRELEAMLIERGVKTERHHFSLVG